VVGLADGDGVVRVALAHSTTADEVERLTSPLAGFH
jgi:selenocysteine lyase/cysteine desulfurase